MTFTSLGFILFFVIIVLGYYLLPYKWRWFWLLIGSSYFYMAFVPKYILILFALIIIDYFLAQRIEASQDKKRKILFLFSILSNIGILFIFKYFNFFNENISHLANFIGWNYSVKTLSLILPLGLSFHTFQSLSYVIEVYKGKYKAEKHLGIYALYVLFFPQLVAGPIERPAHLLPQLKSNINFDKKNIIQGLRLMSYGFIKKLVVADRLSLSVSYAYSNINHLNGPSLFISMIFFSLQLYCDFSGYSDIARGSAKVLGIEVVKNFEQPYFSKSIAEFWRRWHISLSSWFRDYFYFPLAFRKPSRIWLYFSIMATFLVTGLWHGAGWTFAIMGILHGFYIVLGQIFKNFREKFNEISGINKFQNLKSSIEICVTFLLASFSWIFFRSPDIGTAINFVKNMFSNWTFNLSGLMQAYRLPYDFVGINQSDLNIVIMSILALFIIEYHERKKPIGIQFDNQSLIFKTFIYSSMVITIIVFSLYSSKQFIYFQF